MRERKKREKKGKKGKKRKKEEKREEKKRIASNYRAGSKGRIEERASASYETAASGSATPPMISYVATTNLNSHHGGKVSAP